MPSEAYQALSEAEKIIEQRKKEREGTSSNFRAPIAAEQIADELTRLVAEVRTLRDLYAQNAALARGRSA